MPEYLALVHHRNAQDPDAQPPDFTPDDLTKLFLKMERSGVAKVN